MGQEAKRNAWRHEQERLAAMAAQAKLVGEKPLVDETFHGGPSSGLTVQRSSVSCGGVAHAASVVHLCGVQECGPEAEESACLPPGHW